MLNRQNDLVPLQFSDIVWLAYEFSHIFLSIKSLMSISIQVYLGVTEATD